MILKQAPIGIRFLRKPYLDHFGLLPQTKFIKNYCAGSENLPMLKTVKSLAKLSGSIARSSINSRIQAAHLRYQFFDYGNLRAASFSTFDQKQDASLILEEVEAKVFQVLRAAQKTNQEKLSRTATFEELGYDSLEVVEMVVALEENFGIDVTDEEAEKIKSVKDAIAIFHKYMLDKFNKNKLAEMGMGETGIVPGSKRKKDQRRV